MSTLFVNNLNTASGSTITVPTGKQLIGTDSSSIVAPGMIIQMVSASFNTQAYTTSTSFVTSGHTVTITPKFSNSKILISHKGTVYNEGQNLHQYRTVYRGGSALSGNEGFTLHSAGEGTNGRWSSMGFDYLDSPATTSSTTYTMYYRASSGSNSYYCYGTLYPQVTTLYEIAQ